MSFPVQRSGDLGFDAVLHYHTADGSAHAGTDYDAVSDMIVIPAGSSTATIPVTIEPNIGTTPNLTFQLVIDAADGGAPALGFSARQGFPVGTHPRATTTTDVNGDGKPDLIAINLSDGTVSVRLNTTAAGATLATFGTEYTFAVGVSPTALAADDLNGDGKPDLAVTNNDGSGTLSVLLNTTANGAGVPTFAAQQVFATGTSPSAIRIADINGDGKKDLVVANNGTLVSVYLNTTTTNATSATFAAPQPFTTGLIPVAIAIDDFNTDGKLDLAVSNFLDAAIAVFLNTTTPGAMTVTFATKQTIGTGSGAAWLTTGDFDGDGKPDLAWCNVVGGNGNVAAVFNKTATGAGTTTFGTEADFAVGANPSSLIAADVSGDGKPDLIVANRNDNTVTVLFDANEVGDTQPRFGALQALAAGTAPQNVAVDDLNADGRLDLVVADETGNSVSTLLNSGTPTFAVHQTFATGTAPAGVASDDFNGDGRPDIAVANATDATVSVLLNTTPAGTALASFSAQHTFATGTNPAAVTTADINGDGKPDIVVVNANAATVSVLLDTTAPGNATPTFATQQTFAVGTNPAAIVVLDVNNDGKPDLAVANQNASSVSVLLNATTTGSMTAAFVAKVDLPVGSTPLAIAKDDINGDGKPDIVVANFVGNLSVLLNTTASLAMSATFATQQTFAGGSFPTGIVTADLDGDGKPDIIETSASTNSVAVLMNTTATNSGTATFAAVRSIATQEPFKLTAADLNGDGRTDLVATNTGSAISVLVDTTLLHTPTLAIQHSLTTGTSPVGIAIADIDGDGEPDLITANRDSNNVSVLLGTSRRATFSGSPATGTIVHDYLFGNGFE